MKLRSDFVTNSSSANYCVTLRVEGNAREHAEIDIHTYDHRPWCEDTEQGCKNYDRQARALSYRINNSVATAKELDDTRELSDALLSAVHEHGWGVSHDWWQERENRSYFHARWYRDRLLEARSTGAEESAADSWTFDFDAYVDELRSKGKMLEGMQPKYPPGIMTNAMDNFRLRWYRDLTDNICQGWSFAIDGWPSIYQGKEELETYIVEHGGTVDDSVKSTTDFVICCEDGEWDGYYDDETWVGFGYKPYWTFDVCGDLGNLEQHLTDCDALVSYEWKSFEGELDDIGSIEDFCESFRVDEGCFDHLFREALGDIVSEGLLDVSYFVIPEHEFVRRFDPTREKHDGMTYSVAHPIIAQRFAQVLKSSDITPENLETVTYERHISSFGDSIHLLGFDVSDRGTDVEYDDDGRASWWSWGDDEDVDQWYRND